MTENLEFVSLKYPSTTMLGASAAVTGFSGFAGFSRNSRSAYS